LNILRPGDGHDFIIVKRLIDADHFFRVEGGFLTSGFCQLLCSCLKFRTKVFLNSGFTGGAQLFQDIAGHVAHRAVKFRGLSGFFFCGARACFLQFIVGQGGYSVHIHILNIVGPGNGSYFIVVKGLINTDLFGGIHRYFFKVFIWHEGKSVPVQILDIFRPGYGQYLFIVKGHVRCNHCFGVECGFFCPGFGHFFCLCLEFGAEIFLDPGLAGGAQFFQNVAGHFSH